MSGVLNGNVADSTRLIFNTARGEIGVAACRAQRKPDHED